MFLSLEIEQTISHIVRMGRPKRTVADRAMMAHLGTRLRWVREALEANQQTMAEAIGVTQTAWSLYERGLRWPDEFSIPRLLGKLKISREYLLENTLEGVEPGLAIRLAAMHPELVETSGTARRKGRRRS